MGKWSKLVQMDWIALDLLSGMMSPPHLQSIQTVRLYVRSIDAGQPIKISTTLKWSVNMSADFFRPLPILFAIFFL